MHFTLFNLISLATLAVLGGVSAQDDGAGFVTKCVNPGEVALTFDDGPSPFTPELLGYLATAKIKATFFVLGKATNEFPKTLKQAFDAGHQIALHSNTHADMNKLTPAQVLEEYQTNIKAVESAIGLTPAHARPPFGNCNAACAKVLQGQLGLTIVQWNCDSNDWQYETNVADQPKLFTNMQAIINPSNPKTDSFITLQHDIKDYSVKYVPKIIEMISAKGYNFVTVEQCLGGKIPAYKGGKAAPAPATAPATAPAKAAKAAPAAAAPAAAPAPAAADPAYPSAAPAPASAAFAESPAPSSSSPAASSADKITSAYGLKLVGALIFGYFMY